MKMRLKILLLSLIILSLLFCSNFLNSAATAQDTLTTLRVALYPYVPNRHELFYQLEATFEQEHPGVNLELIESSDLVDKYYSGGLEKVDADVYEIDTVLLSDMIELNKITSLDILPSGFTQEALEAVKREGKTYGIPHWLCGNFLFYRKGDTEVEKAVTWKELNEVLRKTGKPLFVDFKGSSTLGEWYLTLLAEQNSLETAQKTIIESSSLDKSVVSNLSSILMNCPAGFCRNDKLHDNTGYYARAFISGKARAYIGYSESLYYGLQHGLDNCLPTSGCLSENEVAVRRLPTINNDKDINGIGWVDALAIPPKLSEQKKKIALEFINFTISDRAYKKILEPLYGQAPPYLIPARKLSNINNAPLYQQLYPAHAGRKTGTLLKLNSRLREFGKQLDQTLPNERTDV